ncbi:hypothetical protein [Tenacibaculum aiptasiae]|uniref:hypothetical protein n=1 Tax=Tenacibaculum aiptasiae TaxID=426481 RepID=UPI00232B1B4F|nr:hypothetical protein [Tenacibaculum aiptasiae]
MSYTPKENKIGLNNNSNIKVIFKNHLCFLPIYQESLISLIQSSLTSEENESYFKKSHVLNCLDILKGLMISTEEYVQLSKQQEYEEKKRKRDMNKKIKEMEEKVKEQKKIIAELLSTGENDLTSLVSELGLSTELETKV